MEDFEGFRKVVEEQLRRVEFSSRQLESSFMEFQGTFGLVLRSSFVDQGAKELLQDSFLRLEDRLKNELSNNEESYTSLKNWFSFYMNTPISEIDDGSADRFQASNGR